MKVLIVTADYYPDNSPRSFRASELVKELSNRGHEVHVLCPYKGKEMEDFNEEFGIQYTELLLPALLKKNSNIIIKLIKWVLFKIGLSSYFYFPTYLYKNNVSKALQYFKDFDLLISVAIPHSIHWGVAEGIENSQNKIAKKWIADCGDPFMGNPVTKRWSYLKKYEKKFCRMADFITIPTAKSLEAYYEEFRDKIKIIPQGFNFESRNDYLKKYQRNDPLKFAYAGRFYEKERDPGPFLSYLNSIEKEFEFHIYTKDEKLVSKYVKDSGGRIIIHPFIPRQQLLKNLSTMDFLINFSNKSGVQVPSKLIDYYLTGRPILDLEYNFSPKVFNEFMNYKYDNSLKICEVEKYNIKNVVDEFIYLAKL